MATDVSAELNQFRDFLDKRQGNQASFSSLDEAVDEFRRHQRELTDLKAKLRVAEQQIDQGQIGPFDAQATMRRVNERLVEKNSAE